MPTAKAKYHRTLLDTVRKQWPSCQARIEPNGGHSRLHFAIGEFKTNINFSGSPTNIEGAIKEVVRDVRRKVTGVYKP